MESAIGKSNCISLIEPQHVQAIVTPAKHIHPYSFTFSFLLFLDLFVFLLKIRSNQGLIKKTERMGGGGGGFVRLLN